MPFPPIDAKCSGMIPSPVRLVSTTNATLLPTNYTTISITTATTTTTYPVYCSLYRSVLRILLHMMIVIITFIHHHHHHHSHRHHSQT